MYDADMEDVAVPAGCEIVGHEVRYITGQERMKVKRAVYRQLNRMRIYHSIIILFQPVDGSMRTKGVTTLSSNTDER